MVALRPVRQARRLQAVPDLGHHETHAGALTTDHLGRTICVRTPSALIAGVLDSIQESRLYGAARPLLRIRTDSTVGDLTLGLHPAHPVTVLPAEHTVTITITPKTDRDKADCQ